MEDEKIVQLYWDRNEQAIAESSLKYGAYCRTIAGNILADPSDAEECVNDTWLHAWNAMPPKRPSILSAFLGRITRNLSFDRYRTLHRGKRGGHSVDLILDELEECVSGKENPEAEALASELGSAIDAFLLELPKERRYMFILRYWYAETIGEIADRFQMSENRVSVTLGRIRAKLRTYLAERGYDV